MKNDLSDVKVGDPLFSCRAMRYVEVADVDDRCVYKIGLADGNRYTFEGKHHVSDEHPFLFKTAQDAAEYFVEIPRPLPDLAIDTPIIVWKNDNLIERKRYFKEWNKDGYPVCFVRGGTSWSSEGETFTWTHWKLPRIERAEK